MAENLNLVALADWCETFGIGKWLMIKRSLIGVTISEHGL
jgi:hypothetical protein